MLKERKWAKDAQGGRNWTRKPLRNGMGQGNPCNMNANLMTMLGHSCSRPKRGLVSTGQITPQQE